MPRFEIKIISAKSLPFSNPYAVVSVGAEQQKTSVADGSTSPSWQELLRFNNISADSVDSEQVTIKIMNKDLLGDDDTLGHATISLAAVQPDTVDDRWLQLQGAEQQSQVRVRLCMHTAATDVLSCGGNGSPPSAQRLSDAAARATDSATADTASAAADVVGSSSSLSPISTSVSAAEIASASAPASAKKTGLNGLSDEQVAKIRINFEMWDTDGSGELDKSEATAALLHYFPQASATDIVREIQRLDVNKDGVLSLTEFATIARMYEV